jgi:hypothetical protein
MARVIKLLSPRVATLDAQTRKMGMTFAQGVDPVSSFG